MFKKFIFLFLFSFFLAVNSQNRKDDLQTEQIPIGAQLYTKCFDNLNQDSDIFEKYPELQTMKFCSLMECTVLLSSANKEIQTAVENRLRAITKRLYKEGNPVYLISGSDSYSTAMERNENIEDDNKIVYICVAADFLRATEAKAQQIVNKQTMQLINQKTAVSKPVVK